MTKVACHCGAVELRVTLAEPIAQGRRCDCSFCRRRGVPAVTVKRPDLEVVKGADKLSVYTWGTGTAKHHFCSVCGIYTHHQRRSNPNEYGVNMAAIDGVHLPDYDPIGWFDGVNHPSDAG
ncbi:GFA family protein [Pseudooctadecabacter jejudonensis]|uniref:Putative glutathione-dependent formaldehyde-activating enzyme n=1 Tax=Pseudooctadecabacter jejudonensis TaxID=1391910 RepID=A0A1Y5RRZ3_9RHOB|nr:GFA family protein [Pseudooctadecabacter jejudonensis]SLN23613.1 Putative glutathione-dependent formaldehyde-activating enzyme [Pseudooctadecabacter jejudonensis]